VVSSDQKNQGSVSLVTPLSRLGPTLEARNALRGRSARPLGYRKSTRRSCQCARCGWSSRAPLPSRSRRSYSTRILSLYWAGRSVGLRAREPRARQGSVSGSACLPATTFCHHHRTRVPQPLRLIDFESLLQQGSAKLRQRLYDLVRESSAFTSPSPTRRCLQQRRVFHV